MQLYFLFLEFILPPLNEFNTTFQADEVKVCFLYQEMEQLLRKYLAKFVTVAVIKGRPVTEVPFQIADNQLPDNLLAVGLKARGFISSLDNTDLINRFFKYVRMFYVESVIKNDAEVSIPEPCSEKHWIDSP
ncbi:uncharacterized protein LOC121375499 isoform X2 [Gigantopelta aegis]|uniref:uncharacterized protein LOC121375499 isoform X2 n=1 Tax=Gigantopelta aegis TaxID=1735272 RepID=UPI001B889AD3|nr:uncharacterized protein LOC121375499 isoform X2 [Gigantopelta aegis]